MAVTADEVQVVFSANYTQYSAAIDAVDAEFTKRLNHMGAEAAKAGNATKIAFDQMSGSFNVVEPAAKKADDRLKQLGKTMNTNRLQAGNLAAQFNDIGVSLAGGMSPLLVALQQGTQINQVLGQLEGGVFAALRTSILSIISPLSLLTIGLIAGGGYLVQWGIDALSAADKVETLDDVIKSHENTLKAIKDAYGEAAKARKEFTEADAASLGSDLRTTQSRARAGVRSAGSDFLEGQGFASTDVFTLPDYGAFQSIIDDLKKSSADALPTMQELRDKLVEVYDAALAEGKDPAALENLLTYALDAGAAFLEIPEKMQPFSEALRTLRSELESNTPGAIDTFVASVDRIGETSPALREVADGLIQGSAELGRWADLAADAAAQQDYLASATGQYNQAVEQLSSAIDGVRSEKAQQELRALAERAQEGDLSVEELSNALAAISGYAPDLTAAISTFTNLFNVVTATRNAVVGFTGKASTGGPARYQSDMVDLPVIGPVPEGRGTPELGGYPWEKFGGGGRKKRGGGGRQNEYERLKKQTAERTASLQAEAKALQEVNPYVEDYEYSLTKAKYAQDLLTAAEQAGVKVTPDVQKSIDAMASSYAAATAQVNQLKDSNRQAQETMQEINDLGKDVAKGFIDDLRNGVSVADALSNALDKVVDKLIDMSVNSIFDNIGKGLLGGGKKGGLFGGSIIPGILHDGGRAGVDGYGHSRSVPASAFRGAKRYHSGTLSAGIGPDEIPAILQKGEIVLPRGSKMGRSVTYAPTYIIDATGADQAAVARLQRGLEERDRTESQRVASHNKDRTTRETRP